MKNMNSLRNAYLRQLSAWYFISFPKSGRTWIKSFLANYYAAYFDLPIFYDFSPVLRVGGRKNVPRIVFEHARHRGESEYKIEQFMQRIYKKKIIFLARDPRDVVFSYYFQLIKRVGDRQVRGVELSEFIRQPSVGMPGIIKFMNEWYNSNGKFNEFFLIKYEDFVNQPQVAFKRLLDLLGVPIDLSILEKALLCSVDSTRKIEEGGVVKSNDLLESVERKKPFFETTNGSMGATKRYDGDDSIYAASFNEEDISFMNDEIKKLDPVFGYVSRERA